MRFLSPFQRTTSQKTRSSRAADGPDRASQRSHSRVMQTDKKESSRKTRVCKELEGLHKHLVKTVQYLQDTYGH